MNGTPFGGERLQVPELVPLPTYSAQIALNRTVPIITAGSSRSLHGEVFHHGSEGREIAESPLFSGSAPAPPLLSRPKVVPALRQREAPFRVSATEQHAPPRRSPWAKAGLSRRAGVRSPAFRRNKPRLPQKSMSKIRPNPVISLAPRSRHRTPTNCAIPSTKRGTYR